MLVDDGKQHEESRGRGRPKNPKEPPPPRRGILSKPDNDDHIIEFVYNEPMNFKRIWQIFKGMKAERNIISFQRDHIMIYCKDNRDRSFTRCLIDCSSVTSYYCREPHIIVIDSNALVNITNKIVSEYSTIQINRMVYNDRSVQMVFNPGNAVKEVYEIDIIEDYDTAIFNKDFESADHIVHINAGWKYFKRITTDLKTKTIELIQEHPQNAVTMRHCLAGKVLSYYEFISHEDYSAALQEDKESKKKPRQLAYFTSRLGKNDVFHISIRPEYIKAVSHVILNDVIDIYGYDGEKPLKLVGTTRDGVINIINLIDIEYDRMHDL